MIYGHKHVDNILFSLILAAFYGVLFSFLVSNFVETKVLELSDRFLPLRHEGMWLISVSDFFFCFFSISDDLLFNMTLLCPGYNPLYRGLRKKIEK